MYKKELDNGTLLFQEVSIHASGYKLNGQNLYIDIKHGLSSKIILLPKDGFGLLGLSTELTEEQLKDVMPSYLFQVAGIKNAKPVTLYLDFVRNAFVLSTAIEAFQSLKSSLGLIDENKYKKPDECSCGGYTESCGGCEFTDVKWNNEQSKVKKLIVLFNPKKLTR